MADEAKKKEQLTKLKTNLDKAKRHKTAAARDLIIADLTVNHYQTKLSELESEEESEK